MPVVHSCSDLEPIDAGDIQSLTLDTTNTGYFDRSHGGTDGARITRDGTTENVWFEYAPGSTIDSFRVEGHEHVDAGGRIEFYEWIEGEQGWSQVKPRETPLGDSQGGWVSTEHTGSLSENATRLAIQLTGGSKAWGLQVGCVELVAARSVTPSDWGPGRFVDDCSAVTVIDSGQVGSLAVDTSNIQYFNRPHGGTDGARLTRAGTTENVWFEYAPAGEIDSIRVEGHEHMRAGGRIEFYEQTQGSQDWSWVATDERTIGDHDGDWVSTEHRAELSDGAARLAIQLTGGSESWGLQVGCVELKTR
jgi:hypothetical protein